MKLLAFALLWTCASLSAQTGPYVASREDVPEPIREFRAAWIATVWNIDWPSRAGLSPAQQRAEMVALLDLTQQLRMNAVIFQVRPAADALYHSSIEPWSHWLTGKQGRAPSDGYDPLDFTIREAHKRGLEVHAWFNPYRARANQKVSAASTHISKTHPQYLMTAGSQLWLNPAHKPVQDRAVQVMVDVTKRYDVDGIHIDDYFYPYPVGGKIIFNDSAAYNAYRSSGGRMAVTEWRRDNVNTLVQRLHRSIKKEKSHVKFGISPFGIWRPGVPRTIEAGADAFEHMAADSRTWLRQGWVDYLSPQLYWSIDQKPQSFSTLIKWWGDQNSQQRHLWPGVATERIKSSTDRKRTSREITNQIDLTRKHAATKAGTGHIHWSFKALQQDRDGIRNRLSSSTYSQISLVPDSPWLSSKSPASPTVSSRIEGGNTTLTWRATTNTDDLRWWIVQARPTKSKSWRVERILPIAANQFTFRGTPGAVTVRAMTKTGRLSSAKALQLK